MCQIMRKILLFPFSNYKRKYQGFEDLTGLVISLAYSISKPLQGNGENPY